ncbi:MAG: flavodoxin family protein [Eubacteriales bacterium]|nr:flavodoxin family protein [Eubacteriales bacterium]
MKVLLLNGSPHVKGSTFRALTEVASVLQEEGIESTIFHIGTKLATGCLGCGACAGKGRCIFDGDRVNEFLKEMETADALIIGSPVYFAGAAGGLTAFLDRAFFAGDRRFFRHKPASSIVVARRAGATTSLDQLNKYFQIREMPVISSRYWNMAHGFVPEEIPQDEEGCQIMRILARNMAWFLRCKEAGEKAGIFPPEPETPITTSFIH